MPSLKVNNTAETKHQAANPILVDVSVLTITKIMLTLSLCFLLVTMRDFLLLLLISVFIAVTLHPFLLKLEKRGCSRPMGLFIISSASAILFLGLFFILIPPLFNELTTLSTSLPTFRSEIIQNTPRELGFRRTVERILTAPLDTEETIEGVLSFGQYAFSGLLQLLMLLIFSLYFLADGPRAFRWLLPYFSKSNQKNISLTVNEIVAILSAYISGQVFTSVLASIFSFLILSLSGVPATFSLSVLAGIFSIVPIVGFFLSLIPACLLAATISWTTASWVLLSYCVYNVCESYLIIPRVYGTRMRLSGLVILIGMAIAFGIAGIMGSIAVLPILASYPIIERIWLRRQVGPAVVEEHQAVSL